MMKSAATVLLTAALAPGATLAHPGHVAEIAGHAHWIGLAAVLGAAGLAALIWGARGESEDQTADGEADGAPEGERDGA